ncbi:HAD superfamily, subfamily IIIB acid phosphatase [Carex rostrata]
MKSFVLLSLIALLFCPHLILSSPLDTIEQSQVLPRPLILQFTSLEEQKDSTLTQLRCDSWRFGVEANNLAPWRVVPAECGVYVEEYVTGRAYRFDLEMAASESLIYAQTVEIKADGMDAWIFDIDETLLSNLPYYASHGYGSEMFNSEEFDVWVEQAIAPAIESSLILYEEVRALGFKTIFLTGRSEGHMNVTIENLKRAGFLHWDKLILRGANDRGKTATAYKSGKRREIEEEGYRIHGNSGDQWSDLLGYPVSSRSFKLPNPMYFIP